MNFFLIPPPRAQRSSLRQIARDCFAALGVAAVFFFSFPVYAEPIHYASFGSLPILHEGRIKPLDSFARVMLKKMHGKTTIGNKTALMWLAGALFTPEEAVEEAVFTPPSAELVKILALTPSSQEFYSFHEIAPAIAAHSDIIRALASKDSKTLTSLEQEILKLYDNVTLFAQLTGSLSLFMPLRAAEGKSYYDLLKDRIKIDADLKKTVKQKGDKINEYTLQEQRNAEISYRLSQMQGMQRHNLLLRVLPPAWEGTEEWLSFWGVLEYGAGSPATLDLFGKWQQLAKNYKQDTSAFNETLENLHLLLINAPAARPLAINLEVAYNRFDLLAESGWLYGLVIVLMVLRMLGASFPLRVKIGKRARFIPGILMLLAITLHGAALLMRMFILMRPPVSTLYESMIFVSFLAGVIALWMEWKKPGGESLLIGSVLAALLLAAAAIFAADSDTLEVLVAVLNTNFWLGTHVICITAGYAACLIAGAVAHIYLIKRAFTATTQEQLHKIYSRLHKIALVALLFTATGTMLGGIWADQSWGRFWGWDPKENGALWIVLWLIWLLHGRITGQVRELGFAAGMALITIVVALAWVGVNLLNVGLHSYGFTNEAANALLVFCGSELAVVGILAVTNTRRKIKPCSQ